jgi:hypothetical protein
LADWNEKAVRSAAEELTAQGAFIQLASIRL